MKPKDKRRYDHAWHVALNAYNTPCGEFQHWMYEAKTMSHEVSRLKRLFEKERNGKLTKTHKQCSMQSEVPIGDNHLTCCLGVECRKCPHLASLEAADVPVGFLDEMKAWTCTGHIMMEGGDKIGEGYLLTVDDKLFWRNVNESLSTGNGSD